MTGSQLPPIRKTQMCATFRAPVSRPGADGRRECWAAETSDGVWAMERQEGERYLKWALIHVPTDTLACYEPTLKRCRQDIARGSWNYREADPLARYGSYEGPACVVVHWFQGTELHRAVFGTTKEAVAWALGSLEASKEDDGSR